MSDEPLERLIRDERWRQQALDKAAGDTPAPPPEGETSAARLTREWREQDEAERRDEALARRVGFEHPDAPTAAALTTRCARSLLSSARTVAATGCAGSLGVARVAPAGTSKPAGCSFEADPSVSGLRRWASPPGGGGSEGCAGG